jgi:adenosylcobinamide-GDP ribazoletransferase
MYFVHDAALALQFLTRARVPGVRLETSRLGRSLAFFPLAGLALGLVLAGAMSVASGRLAPAVTAALLVAGLAWATGGLHLDGLADVFDGLAAGHADRDRALQIMRDSRVGAHGALALALVLIVKVTAVAEIVSREATWALVLAPVIARFSAVPLVVWFPYARPEGLGRAFHDGAGNRELAIAAVLTAAALAWAAVPTALLAAAGALLVALVLALTLNRKLLGLTGDVYGAAIELTEVTFLVLAGIRWPQP